MNASSFTDLHPKAATVADLLERLTSDLWRGSVEQQRTYLRRQGFVAIDGEVEGRAVPQVTCGHMLVPQLENARAQWTASMGQLFSISLFLYAATLNRPARAETGYEAIRAELVPRLGPPSQEDALSDVGPSSLWQAGQTHVEMYCHRLYPQVLQLGLTHTERNTTYESAFSSPR